jgi:PAS domain S-box-containing protein
MLSIRHLKLRGAFFLISLLLLGYLGFLLLNLYRSYDKIQSAALEQQQYATEKRAIALESFLKDRGEDLVDLAEKQQLSAYFENQSLGMSLEYGLGASLNDLNDAIDRYRLRKKFDGKPLYRRIMFLDADGTPLVNAHDKALVVPDSKKLALYRAVKTAQVKLYIAHDAKTKMHELVLAYPYLFKEHYAGHLLVWINIADLYRHFVESVNSDIEARNSLSILLDHNVYLAVPSRVEQCRIQIDTLPTPSAMKPGKQTFQLVDKQSGKPFPVMAITVPINGTDLLLTSLLPLHRDDKASPLQLVFTTGAIGLLILSGMVLLVRTDLNSRLMETRLEETRLREKAVEEQNRVLTVTAAELKENKQRLALALEGADLGLWDWHLQSGTVTYSDQWASMLGYQLNELEPTVSTWESFVHPDDMPIVQHLIKKHLNGDTPFYESEHRCRTKSGEWRWILDRGRVVEREIDGTPIRMAGSHLDIADRKLAEYELIRLNEELEQRVQEEVSKNREKDTFMLQQDKMASIGQLAAGVAHEINNPMGFIISNLGTLKEYTEAMSSYIATADQMILPAAEQAAQLAELRKSLDLTYILNDLESLLSESLEGADRVKQIVHDLKDFARMDETTVTETDLNQCVRSTVNIVRNELKYVAQLDLQLGELPLVTCNPQQINQVITNLLVNAAQAIEGHGTITVTTQQVERQVVLTIADTGSGIPPEVMKRIFEPFFTTKPVGKGTGLGLTISYDMVRKNGGEISVESEPGKGTTFTITLPVSGAVGERHE